MWVPVQETALSTEFAAKRRRSSGNDSQPTGESSDVRAVARGDDRQQICGLEPDTGRVAIGQPRVRASRFRRIGFAAAT